MMEIIEVQPVTTETATQENLRFLLTRTNEGLYFKNKSGKK
jgi:hypothetical protein